MKHFIATTLISALALSGQARADSLTLNPISDGSLYVCAGCNTVSDGGYVLAAGYIQGAVKFASPAITGKVTQAQLTLNPYGLPLWGDQVSIYGYGTSVGQLDASDADAGTLIGTFTLPSLGYGQDAFFDVTQFVANTKAPFLAFNLRTNGTDVFSSTEYNYGHPAQLHITTAAVPEPGSYALILGGLAVVGAMSLRRRQAI